MHISARRFLLILGSLLLAGLACNIGASGPAPTATQANTPTSGVTQPTNTPGPAVTPTVETAELPTATVQAVYDPATATLADQPYTHPAGLFELLPPANWVVDESESGVSFKDPAEIGYLQVQMNNTGYQIDGSAFEQFVMAREANVFGASPNYKVENQRIDGGNGLASLSKTFMQDGQLQGVVSFYDQEGPIITTVDFWEAAGQAGTYTGLYNEFFTNIQADSQAAFSLPIYGNRFTYSDPQNQYIIALPESWLHQPEEEAIAGLDQFVAPDARAVISILVYPAAPAYDPPVFMQDLLRSNLGLEMQITGEGSSADNRIQYTWTSSDGTQSGLAVLVTDNLPTLMVNGSTDLAYQQFYTDVLETILNSVQRP